MAKDSDLLFKKSGREIKASIGKRIDQLQQRLNRRNQSLDEFLNDRSMVRSLLVRAIGGTVRCRNPEDDAPMHSESEISSEHMQEVRKVCERIFELETRLRKLRLIFGHLADDGVFNLTLVQLQGYGFEP